MKGWVYDCQCTEQRKRITESQTVRGWKGPLWVTQPNPLPKQGHPQQAAQDHVNVGKRRMPGRRVAARGQSFPFYVGNTDWSS